ncbi:unnamed protein product [Cuscuta epithymum]|uniref:Uncharacterized protein n=1 Tax=Cuscuta epithymum TaxID=186058 RepID=A0AAV0G4K3_9ASTE|nr:unnamed protein product [Cuscuta epithymum]
MRTANPAPPSFLVASPLPRLLQDELPWLSTINGQFRSGEADSRPPYTTQGAAVIIQLEGPASHDLLGNGEAEHCLRLSMTGTRTPRTASDPPKPQPGMDGF